MPDCLNDIVTIRGCSNTTPLSGLDLMDAPEISRFNLAQIATDKDTSGIALAERILSNAVIQVRNDLITVLASNQMLVDVSNRHYETSKFIPTTTIPAEAKERGLTVHRAKWRRNTLKKTTIHTIKIFSLTTASSVPVYIHDAGLSQPMTYTYSADLTAGQETTLNVQHDIQGEYAHVTVDGTNVALASSFLECYTGCSGTIPNDCGHTKSYYDGRSLNGREGYGLNVEFSCECDYDTLLCNLAKTSIGNIIYMKARIMLLEERLNSDRLNNLIVYGAQEVKEYHLPKLESEYNTAWTGFSKSLKTIVNQYSGDCIVCNGIRTVVSI